MIAQSAKKQTETASNIKATTKSAIEVASLDHMRYSFLIMIGFNYSTNLTTAAATSVLTTTCTELKIQMNETTIPILVPIKIERASAIAKITITAT
jgi:hypothetical protein